MLRTLTVSKRLALGFGLVVTIGIGIAGYGAAALNELSRDTTVLASDRMVKVAQFNELNDNLNAIARYARNIVISSDPNFQDQEKAKIENLRSRNTELLEALGKTIKLPRTRALYNTIVENRGVYNAAVDRAIASAYRGDKTSASVLLIGEVQTLQDVVFTAVDDSVALQMSLADNLAANAVSAASTGGTLMISLSIVMAVLGATVAWLTGRSIKRALGAEPDDLSELLNHVADGDLSRSMTITPGDGSSVMAALARMQTSLSGVVTHVRHNSESVATASAQIAQGNQDLSQRTEEQASALQQTAATMEELGTTVRNNAESARQANHLAQGASAVAAQGGEVVRKVVITMQGINDSSRKIGDIINVVDAIAFQTNILALNAAVEAARAREQGRGFAVVASEVRGLAQRSAEAAKEIKTLIRRSVEQVEQGTALVDEAGKTMGEIVGSIQRVSVIVAEITSASEEQNSGIQQVGEAVSQMDRATQQNAALVEESAAAAASLKGQALQLVDAVSVFKLSPQENVDAASVATSEATHLH